jgi:hypothetical protein
MLFMGKAEISASDQEHIILNGRSLFATRRLRSQIPIMDSKASPLFAEIETPILMLYVVYVFIVSIPIVMVSPTVADSFIECVWIQSVVNELTDPTVIHQPSGRR